MFGAIPITARVWLDCGGAVLLYVCCEEFVPETVTQWPSPQKMKDSSVLFQENRLHGELLSGVSVLMDGGHMGSAKHGDCMMQSACWEGFTQQNEVTKLFFWPISRELIFAVVNYQGSWHDSKIAMSSRLLAILLTEHTPTGMGLLGDGAFTRSAANLRRKILRGRKLGELKETDKNLKSHG